MTTDKLHKILLTVAIATWIIPLIWLVLTVTINVGSATVLFIGAPLIISILSCTAVSIMLLWKD